MKKLHRVEAAKELMTEALEWSVFHWLLEKRKVRETAAAANAALDKLDQTVKALWSSEAKAAYKQLTAKSNALAKCKPGAPLPQSFDPEVLLLVKRVKEADDAACRARTDAEDTFDEAERQLNTDLAREGCRKAIRQWEFDEKAIRRAEAILSIAPPIVEDLAPQ